MKSLSTCLFAKDFIFPSDMKLSLAGYEILGWTQGFFRVQAILFLDLVDSYFKVHFFGGGDSVSRSVAQAGVQWHDHSSL